MLNKADLQKCFKCASDREMTEVEKENKQKEEEETEKMV
jgi:hypothetical protein